MTTEIFAKIILDSTSPEGKRLTTIHLRYPRFIHAEMMTHRVFSRNARSSRAVPVKTMLAELTTSTVVPLHWGKNQKGMQADLESDELILTSHIPIEMKAEAITREQAWASGASVAIGLAKAFDEAGYHKQLINRILEPYSHIDVLVSATEWANFHWLRDHKDAEPHIQVLAQEVRKAMDASTPQVLQHGSWHLPYITEQDWRHVTLMLDPAGHHSTGDHDVVSVLKKISAARCARISYRPFNGEASIEAEIKRYDDLITSVPMHASPVEHQATPDAQSQYQRAKRVDEGDGMHWQVVKEGLEWDNPDLHGNFVGWIQFRKTLSNEAVW